MQWLTHFDFKNAHKVRVVDIEGEPWFVALDVRRALGLHHTNNMVRILDPDQVSKRNRITLGERRSGHAMSVISESGLYKVLMRSDKPEAREFQDWVTREVLPSIRKTGSYQLESDQTIPLPTDLSEAFQEIAKAKLSGSSMIF